MWNARDRISLSEELSRARQIRVRFKFRFEFDIQNAENIHDMGNLNTQWNKVRDAQRTKTTLGRNKQKEHERLCFFFFFFILLSYGADPTLDVTYKPGAPLKLRPRTLGPRL